MVDHEKVLFVIVFFCCSSNEKEKKPSEKKSWEEFEKRVGVKRNAGKESRKAVGKVQNDIMPQRMSSTASGTLKKC